MLRRSRPLSFAFLLLSTPALAQDAEPPRQLTLQPLAPVDAADGAPTQGKRDVRDEAPRHALVESAFSLTKGAMFASLTGTGTLDKAGNQGEAGVRIGGSPINGLTLHALVGRDAAGKWAPTATLHYRFLGSLEEGFAMGALAQYKTEGFTEAGGEAEIGLTIGVRRSHFYLDANAVAGLGVEESELGEMDAEGKLRSGYQLGSAVRLGAEGQFRRRMAGDRLLAGGRRWDALGGPQVLVGLDRFVIAATFGPTTVNVAEGVGTFGMLTVSALTLLRRYEVLRARREPHPRPLSHILTIGLFSKSAADGHPGLKPGAAKSQENGLDKPAAGAGSKVTSAPHTPASAPVAQRPDHADLQPALAGLSAAHNRDFAAPGFSPGCPNSTRLAEI